MSSNFEEADLEQFHGGRGVLNARRLQKQRYWAEVTSLTWCPVLLKEVTVT